MCKSYTLSAGPFGSIDLVFLDFIAQNALSRMEEFSGFGAVAPRGFDRVDD